VFGGVAQRAGVYRRDDLAPAVRVRGPAIVCEYSATTVVPPGWSMTVDRVGGLLMEHKRGA
jgi:N-methylhydantoinase A